MKSEGKNTLCNGNIPRGMREKGESNKRTRLMKIIGQENYEQICRMQVETAIYSENEEQRGNAQRFLMSSMEPKAVQETYINIPLLPMRTLESIKQNEDTVLKEMCEEFISMEVGERLFCMIEQARKTWEATEMAAKLNEIDNRMKESGI